MKQTRTLEYFQSLNVLPGPRIRRITPYESLYLSMERAFPPFTIQLKIELLHLPEVDQLTHALAAAAHANPGARMLASSGWWRDSRRPPEVVTVDSGEAWSLQHPALHRRLAGLQGPPMELLRWEGCGLIFRCAHALMDAAGLLFFAQETFRAMRGEPLVGSVPGLNDWAYLSRSPHRRALPGMKAEWPSPLRPAREVQRPSSNAAGPKFVQEMRKIHGRVDSPTARIAAFLSSGRGEGQSAESCRIMMPVDLRLGDDGLRTTCNLSNPLILTFGAALDSKIHWREMLGALGRHEQFAVSRAGAALAWLPHGLTGRVVRWMHTRQVRRGRHFFSALSSNLARVHLPSFRYGTSVPKSVAFLPFDTPGAGLSLLTVQHDNALEVAASCPAAYGGEGRLSLFMDDLCAELGRGVVVRSPGVRLKQTTPKIAVAASFVAEPVGTVLAYWMQTFGLSLAPAFAPYGQVFQALSDPAGVFLTNRDGINVILLRLEDLCRSAPRDDDTLCRRLDKDVSDFLRALESAAASSMVPMIVWLGSISNKAMKEGKIFAMIEPLQALLQDRLRQMQGIRLLDDEEVRGWYPVTQEEAPLADALGHIPFSRERYGAIATALARKIVALQVPPFKVIVVDCDNTLWQGVCGEVGPEGVRVTRHHRAFQAFLLRQIDAGMLLCLCSRNASSDVDAVFEQCSEMLLRSEHVVAKRINWRPKSENIISLAEELNLGLDSFVFFDDNPVECAEVEAHCSGVQVVGIPDDPEQITVMLQHLWGLDRTMVQGEALPRTQMYRQNAQRETLRAGSKDFQAFLQSLELQVVVVPPQPDQWERVAELSRRTNQFNMHPEPREASYFRSMDPVAHCLAVDVQDRFGAYGITGLVIYRRQEGALLVDAWLLSCRVLGRGVEHRVLASLGEIALQSGFEEIVFSHMPTPKNAPARAFLGRHCELLPAQDGSPGRRYRINAQKARDIKQSDSAPSEVLAAPEQIEERSSSALLPPGVMDRVAGLHRSVAQILAAAETSCKNALHAPSDLQFTGIEAALLAIAKSVTGGALQVASPEDSLVDLGVDSLQIVMLLDEAVRRYAPGREDVLFGTGLAQFLAKPTIRELAAQLQRLAANAAVLVDQTL